VFLGFANYYRRFIEGYSKIAQPLTALMKGSVKGKKPGLLVWTDVEQRAFETLRDAFTKAPVLEHYKLWAKLKLETNASNFAASGILS